MLTLIDNQSREIFSRAVYGQCHYERDMRQLQRLLEQARALQAVPTELGILNSIAVVSSVCGYFHETSAQFRVLYERYAEINDVDGMVTSLNNQAVTLHTLGDPARALQVYDEGMAVLNSAPEPHYRIRSYGLLLTGRMAVLVMFNRLEEAEQCFQIIQASADAFVRHNRDEYARTMMYGYHNMAELELQRGQIEKALSYYNLAIELAKGGEMQLEIGAIEFTRAHIEAARGDFSAANDFWLKGEAAVDALNMPIMAGVQFMTEARTLHRRGLKQQAEYFTQRALALFEEHHIEQGLYLIHEQLQA